MYQLIAVSAAMLRWRHTRDFDKFQIPVITAEFEPRTSYMQSSYSVHHLNSD